MKRQKYNIRQLTRRNCSLHNVLRKEEENITDMRGALGVFRFTPLPYLINYRILCYLWIATERPCEILTSLKDLEVIEKESVSLTVALSKSRHVQWVKDDVPIPADDLRFQVSEFDSGLKHTLTVSEVTLEENCIFRADVADNTYGVISSSCAVTVKGSWHPFQMKNIVWTLRSLHECEE